MQADRTQCPMQDPASPLLDFLRATLSYRLVTMNGRVVGCWYTSRPHPSPRKSVGGPFAPTSVVYRGLMRTADGRVTGVCGDIQLAPGFKARMLRMLLESTWDDSFTHRRYGAHTFVDVISDAAERVRCASKGMADREDLREIGSVEGRLAEIPEDQARAASARFNSERAMCISRFLDTLDPVMVEAIRPHRWAIPEAHVTDAMIGVAWPLMDRTFDLGAPLQARVLANIDDPSRLRRILRPHCHKVYAEIESTAGLQGALRTVVSRLSLENEEPQPAEATPYGFG